MGSFATLSDPLWVALQTCFGSDDTMDQCPFGVKTESVSRESKENEHVFLLVMANAVHKLLTDHAAVGCGVFCYYYYIKNKP